MPCQRDRDWTKWAKTYLLNKVWSYFPTVGQFKPLVKAPKYWPTIPFTAASVAPAKSGIADWAACAKKHCKLLPCNKLAPLKAPRVRALRSTPVKEFYDWSANFASNAKYMNIPCGQCCLQISPDKDMPRTAHQDPGRHQRRCTH